MEFALDDFNRSGFNDISSLSEEEPGSRIAHLHARPDSSWECEHQRRIKTYQDNTEDRFQERLAGRSKFPARELARAGNTDGQSLHTTNRSEAGESIRTSSVAIPTSFGSSEPSDHSDETGSCIPPPLTSSQSSCVSSLSVSDGMGERALDQSMRLLQEDGTVGNTLFQRGRILECPFLRITECQKEFFVTNSEAWIEHTQSHFIKRRISPPTLNSCGFCEAKLKAVDGNISWGRIMSHVKEHHELGYRLAHARIDFSLVEYLWQKGLLTQSGYRDLKPGTKAQDVPSPPSLSEAVSGKTSCNSSGHNILSPSLGLYECILATWSVCVDRLLREQRDVDLEMAMGSYSDGYRSGIEGGKACICITCFGLVDGPSCSTIPDPSDNLSIYARAKTGERSPPAITCASSDCSATCLCKHGSLYTWIGGRTASNPSALDEGCQTYQNATVFTMNEKDPDLIVVDFGFGHIRARGISHERRHDASLAASPALICLEEGPWQQIRRAGDCSDSKGCPARRLVKLHGFDPMSEVNAVNMGQKDILEKRDAFNSCFSALQKMRMASSARAKLGNKKDKQVTEHFERLMEDAFIQLKELDRRAGDKWILNKPGAKCQSCQHIHPAHQIQGMLEVYKLAIDAARSLSAARRLTQEIDHVPIKEKTLQTPSPPHTPPCDKSALYDLGAYSTSSTFKMRWNSRRPDLLIDTACLLFGAIAGPPIQWVTLRSMHIGSSSLLDQKILQVLPVSAKLVASLESQQNVAMALMFSSTSMSVALLCNKVAATTTGSGRSAVFICFWLAMVLGASVWNTIGGSAAEFFPVFLPVATTIGATCGLLCQRR